MVIQVMVMVGVEKVTMLDSDFVDDGCSNGNDDGGVDNNSGVDTYGGNDLGCADGKSKYFCSEGTPGDDGSNGDGEVDANDNGGSGEGDDNIGDNNDGADVDKINYDENDTVNGSGDEGGDNADSNAKMVKMIKMMIKVIMVVKIMI